MTSFVYNQITRSENAPLFNVGGEFTGYKLTTPDEKAQMAGACIQKAWVQLQHCLGISAGCGARHMEADRRNQQVCRQEGVWLVAKTIL